jgi:AcrR family transcriptional regulator
MVKQTKTAMKTGDKTADRRQALKDVLVTAAERAIASEGLGALRARDLAAEAGCAVGAIYNVVADLDELILLVNSRTFAALERRLVKAVPADAPPPAAPAEAMERLATLSLAYMDFAAANTARWRAIFEHRLPVGTDIPEWYAEEQRRLFNYVEGPLRVLQPEASAERIALLARTIVSAVHGIVMLGLEEKLYALSRASLREQVTFVVSAIGRGLTS